MTAEQKAALAAELEQWIFQNPSYTQLEFRNWIEGKLRDLYRALLVATFVEFVWEAIQNGSQSLSQRCAFVAEEFASRSVEADPGLGIS